MIIQLRMTACKAHGNRWSFRMTTTKPLVLGQGGHEMGRLTWNEFMPGAPSTIWHLAQCCTCLTVDVHCFPSEFEKAVQDVS